MIAPNDYSDREFYDRQSFADIIGEAVHNHVTEVPAIEIIGILETAKACVIQQAIKELRDEDEEWLVYKLVYKFFYYDLMSTLPHLSTDFIG